MEKALLRLFNAVRALPGRKTKHSQEVISRTVRNGYILQPSISPSEDLLSAIEGVIGLSGEKANASFHKSWSVVRDSPIEQLAIQQIVHYITTYGFEFLGIYHEDTVYIPREELELPEVREDIPLVVIKAMTTPEILEGIIGLGSGVALSQQTLDDIMEVVRELKFTESLVEDIKNRELKALLYDFYGLVPEEPVEYLRYVVAKLTGESLLIKNKYLIEKIRASDGKALDKLIKKAPDGLASIFLRYKPLFLAMKCASNNKAFFNRLRKRAERCHEPLKTDFLNSVTSLIKADRLSLDKLGERLGRASVFRKIRLAYSLHYRLHAGDSIVYRVRNGRGWATQFEWEGNEELTREALELTLSSIANGMRNNVSGVKFYIPSNVHYALPATEKQFTGNFPTGSYVSVLQDLIVGIHWTDTNRRIDLDLSAVNVDGKYGWDAGYRSGLGDILFSGDMTFAPKPNGATELFYFAGGVKSSSIMFVNYYNFDTHDPVECKIMVASERPQNFGKNYMVDIGNIAASANVKINKKQNVLGIIAKVNGENRVYFANVSIGNSITSSSEDCSVWARDYFYNSMVNSIGLIDVLKMAGAKVVKGRPGGEDFVDLSPVALDKRTILDLFRE